jgi:hypothetical protein
MKNLIDNEAVQFGLERTSYHLILTKKWFFLKYENISASP